MITAELVRKQIEKEIEPGAEHVEDQCKRLEVEGKSISEELLKIGFVPTEAAAFIGGMCMGLEFAGVHSSARSLDHE